MQILDEKTAKGIATFTIEVSVEEMDPYRTKAAATISKARAVPGFRPGAAPVEMVERSVGAQIVMEEAAEHAVPHFFTKAIKEKNLETVGQPHIEVLTLAPGNPFKFRAAVALVPSVTVGDFSKLKVKRTHTEIKDADVGKVVKDLQKMQSKEVMTTEPVGDMSKVVVDMQMTLDNVLIEGGETKSHAIYMNEEYYIPGLKDQIKGAKAGETKTFTLPFPKEHYNKNIAGKKIDFSVNIKDVYAVDHPEVNDEFASKLGQKSVEDLKTLIHKNLSDDATKKDDQAYELAILEAAMKLTHYSDIPDNLVNEEVRRMMREFEARIVEEGGSFDEYLSHMKKTREALMLEITPQAIERVKIGLLLRAIVKKESITASEDDVLVQCEVVAPGALAGRDWSDDRKKELREYAHTIAVNRKAIAWITDQVK